MATRHERLQLLEFIRQRLDSERKDIHRLLPGPVVIGAGVSVKIIPNHGYDGIVKGNLDRILFGQYDGETTPYGYSIKATSESKLICCCGEPCEINVDDTFYAQRENIEKVSKMV